MITCTRILLHFNAFLFAVLATIGYSVLFLVSSHFICSILVLSFFLLQQVLFAHFKASLLLLVTLLVLLSFFLFLAPCSSGS